jgi:Tfp pilus assembly major pilin PilA
MAFKLRRRRKKKKKLSKKELLLKKLALMRKKLKKKSKKKIESKKLNNNKQDEAISINININNDINTGELTRDMDWSTRDHYMSTTGGYRKSRIDNRKY